MRGLRCDGCDGEKSCCFSRKLKLFIHCFFEKVGRRRKELILCGEATLEQARERHSLLTIINSSSIFSIGMPPPGSFPPPVPPPGALPPGIPPAMPPPPMPPGAGGHGPPSAGTPGAGHPGHGHSHPHPFPPGGMPHPGRCSLLGKGGMSLKEDLYHHLFLPFFL